MWHYKLGAASKPNRRLTGGSFRFRAVVIVWNNRNRAEPDGTAGQPAVRFWSRPLSIYISCKTSNGEKVSPPKQKYKKLKDNPTTMTTYNWIKLEDHRKNHGPLGINTTNL